MKNPVNAIRAVIVDNDQSELDDLVRGMHRAHIPVLPLLYSADSGIIDLPEISSLQVRLLFVDMNLTDLAAPSAKDIAPTIAEVISGVISKDNGPYALIFWSKHAHLVEDVVKVLATRHSDIPTPIVIGALDKNDFKVMAAEGVSVDLNTLHAAIDSVISKSPQLNALLMWERDISNAASRALVTLSKFCEPAGKWEVEAYSQNLEKILSKVAEEAVGKRNAIDKPEEAIHLGLQPLLMDSLERDFSVSAGRDVWKQAMPSLNASDSENPNFNQLNSFYCISQNIAHVSATDRGAFVRISDDHLTDEKFKEHFGKGINALAEDFINVAGLTSADKESARKSITWGLIEISADCDHAQKKSRLFRYMLAAVVPNTQPERTTFTAGGKPADRKHNAIYRVPEVVLTGGEIVVIFANYRYLLGLTASSRILGKVLLRMRGPILGELLYNYSKYVARPGVISFAP